MFTGLIEEVGEITSVTRKGNSAQITVKAGKILKDTKIIMIVQECIII